ncbi:NPC1-like intracellular cholesterol transporter 1 [Dermacentor variabilis]|uniref:NPC1-like intracellular cholesterol transporter 1 n=1 Tax=Dermacentor variabilis TaxID=34621 RepID=UPI003F5BDEC9
MSNSWLFTVALTVTLVSSALAECVTYGNCGTDPDSGKPLPCAAKRHPVPLESQLLEKACPALLDPSGEPTPVCCDATQAKNMVSGLEDLRSWIVKTDVRCFPNFQNLVCQAYCSPKQSKFIAVNSTSTTESGELSATELVYAVYPSFADGVYAACENTRTPLLGLKLMTFMCKKSFPGKCSPQRFLDFIGSVASEGGHSPVKMKFEITKSQYTVGDRKLEPHNPSLI